MTYNTSTPAECAVADYKLMKMQGWPGRDTRPASVAEAMKIAIRKKETSHHSTFIEASGAEAAIQACKTEAQYRFILKLFSTDEIRPFAQQLPLKQLGDVFSMDIGL
jgi:hypothetical protein